MKLTVKTLKGSHFEIRVQPSDSVSFLIYLLFLLSLFYISLSLEFSSKLHCTIYSFNSFFSSSGTTNFHPLFRIFFFLYLHCIFPNTLYLDYLFCDIDNVNNDLDTSLTYSWVLCSLEFCYIFAAYQIQN